MRRFLALTRKEVSGILMSPPILFATAFFVLLDSFALYLAMARGGAPVAVFDDVALFMLFTSLFTYPLVSMRAFSDDNVSGTLEPLLTAPVSHAAVVLAKFAGCMAFAVLYLLHGVVHALLLAYGGNLDWHATLAAFLALLAFGCLALSMGVFFSSLTYSPVAAAAGTAGVLLFLAMAADLDPYSGTIADILHTASFIPHAKRWISGQLDTRGLVYFVSGTALFLFYAWLAIRARQPEKRTRNATVRRRLIVTCLLVIAGAVLLLTQFAVLHINGFWESGNPLGPNLARVPRRWLIPIVCSLGAFVWSVFTLRAARRAARVHGSPRVRKYATISDSQVMKAPRYYYEENLRARRRIVVAAVCALAATVNLNWLAHYPFRTFADSERLGFLVHLQERSWDVSRDGRNSLSATTRRTLEALQGRAEVYSFLPEGLEVNDVPVAEEMRRLLSRYTDYNQLVGANFADAVRDPELAARRAEELDIRAPNLAELVVVEYQGRRLIVPAASLAMELDASRRARGAPRWVFDGENRLTQALLHLIDPRVPTVFFTYGHMEYQLSAATSAGRSASRFAEALTAANMRVRQHVIFPGAPIPPECDLLIVASPRTPFREGESQSIREYLDRGGKLLTFAPPRDADFHPDDDPLNRLLFELGGDFRDDLTEDAVNNLNGDPLAILARNRSGEAGERLVFPASRTIRDNPRSPEAGWRAERLVETYADATATDSEGNSRPGPFTLLYRASRDTDFGEARAATVASGAMIADAAPGGKANTALMVRMAEWLAGREESRGIEPRAWVDRRIRLTGTQTRAVLWIGVVAAPLAWLLAGIAVWWIRRD